MGIREAAVNFLTPVQFISAVGGRGDLDIRRALVLFLDTLKSSTFFVFIIDNDIVVFSFQFCFSVQNKGETTVSDSIYQAYNSAESIRTHLVCIVWQEIWLLISHY